MILGPSGQNIYPEEIEDMYMNLPLVSEVLVVERERKLVALVFPDYEAGKSAGLNQQQVLAHLEDDRKKINEMLPGYSQSRDNNHSSMRFIQMSLSLHSNTCAANSFSCLSSMS